MDIAYWCMLLLGCGTLFPWNAFITAADYYNERFPATHVDRLVTVTYLPINFIVLAFLVRHHVHVRPKLRIIGGFVIFSVAVLAMPLLDMAAATSSALGTMLLLVALCGAADGFAQGALFGLAANFPTTKYTQALIAGTAVSGVAVSLLRVVTKAALPDTPDGLRQSANIYFATAGVVCVACLAVYTTILPRLAVVKTWKEAMLQQALDTDFGMEKQLQQLPSTNRTSTTAAAAGAASDGDRLGGLLLGNHSNQRSADHALERSSLLNGIHSSSSRNIGTGDAAERGLTATIAAPPTVGNVLWQVKHLSGALAMVYTVTLSIFPGVLAEDLSSAQLGSWYPITLIALFNIFDCLGKTAPSIPFLPLPSNERVLWLAMGRVLFLPAFHFAAISGAGPVVVGILTTLLAVSNGFLTSVAMMAAPGLVEPRAGALCGNLMVLSLIAGLCIGAACGFLWLL